MKLNLHFDTNNMLERYILVLISVGLPFIAFIYFDWRAALAVLIVVQIIIGLLALRATPEPIEDDNGNT